LGWSRFAQPNFSDMGWEVSLVNTRAMQESSVCLFESSNHWQSYLLIFLDNSRLRCFQTQGRYATDVARIIAYRLAILSKMGSKCHIINIRVIEAWFCP